MGATKRAILLAFGGDVLVDRDDPHEVFSEIRDLLRAPDLLFGNLESPYSDTPENAVTAQLVLCPRLHNLDAFARAGFHVMSLANNHIVDAGHAALVETQRQLTSRGIATCGAGENLEAARRPAVLEREGMKVGFLAFASTFPHGYEARSTVPGLAPLRAHNHFYDVPECFAPGYLPRIETLPDPTDHRNMESDMQALRKSVDLLVMSFHWGDHLRPFVLTDHEKRTARLCIDQGADLVLGHHHHLLRGVEWYKGKPIFYGLGHLVFDFRLPLTDELKAYFEAADPDSYCIFPREGWPLLPLHPETRMTLLGWAQAENNTITEVGFIPCRLRPDGRVTAVHPDSIEGKEIVGYVNRCNESQKLNGRLITDGAPVVGGYASVRVVPLD